MRSEPPFEREDILAVLPHRPPFLFVDRVVSLEPDRRIVAERSLRADEPHFAGHFPDYPVMPGVLTTDALAQTSGLLIGISQAIREGAPPPPTRIYLLASANVKFRAPAFPGETLRLEATAEKQFGNLFSFVVEATAGRKLVCEGRLALARTVTSEERAE
jgi:3-hydroxyacyl-[acyl-carrier-protein] dehydratase